ncbi:hypothetical protein pEaSNUABM11_00154 [Erwinia phage pEa_SNUABM_11]|nr:hypothetical protein pEaSNUABM11_00154 [Erwinia phage pEa_SNUABM_11]
MSTLRVYTIQMGKWRKAVDMGIPLLNITIKSGEAIFAPDWDFLMTYKDSAKGPEDEAAYTQAYAAKINRKLKEFPNKFSDIFNNSEIALACYCAEGKFCHRHLFVKVLKQLGTQLNIHVEYVGEIN